MSRHYNKMIYAIDFDGTLCDSSYPACGDPIMGVLEKAKRLKAEGHYLILNTCRYGKSLQDAVEWCASHGLFFDKVNENLDFMIDLYGDTRKIYANVYVDDKNVSILQFVHEN